MSRTQVVIQAAHFYPGRIVTPNLIVVHCTASPNRPGSALAVGGYFSRPSSGGSTQWVSDDTTDVRCVRDEDTCWGAKGHNSNGVHFELCGEADWSYDEWMIHRATLEGSAVLMAQAMIKYKIPFAYPAPIINGKAQFGIHTHYGLPGNDHSDPSPGPSGKGQFPMPFLLGEIKKNLGLGHRLSTGTVASTVRSLADIKKRNIITIVITTGAGERKVYQGWKESKNVLNYLATGGALAPTAVVEIAWQGSWFRYDQKQMRNIARSIYTRYA